MLECGIPLHCELSQTHVETLHSNTSSFFQPMTFEFTFHLRFLSSYPETQSTFKLIILPPKCLTWLYVFQTSMGEKKIHSA